MTARLLIAASGTGGHIFPALAIAAALPGWQIHWLGVPDRLEVQLVPDNYQLHSVAVGGLQGSTVEKSKRLLQLLLAVPRVMRLLRRERIQAVLCTGGYIAAPAILAARALNCPVLLHESNAVPGRVTRLLGRACSRVALGFEAAAAQLPSCRVQVTGMPVRTDFFHRPDPLPWWVPRGDGPLLVVMGGSQGARGLNRMVREQAMPWLAAGCRMVHLTGHQDPDCGSLDHPAYVERLFSDHMPLLLHHADLVISRAGAGSISELAVCCCPAVLVPYPYAADDHQSANAAAVAAVGAAVIVRDSRNSAPLARAVWRLLGPRLRGVDPALDPLVAMATAMATVAQTHGQASVMVANVLKALLRQST